MTVAPAPFVQPASAGQIADYPREYALVQQAGAADKQTIHKVVEEFGSAPVTFTGDSAPFSEVASALHRKCSHVAEGCSGNCLAFAAHDTSGKLVPYRFDRRPVGPDDVRIQITHAGICHSDLHQIKGEWGNSKYPMVPGHEIVGIVTEVGANVTSIAPGQRAGVGCMVNSCGGCRECKEDLEQHCSKCVYTYNGFDVDGTPTQGGYSTHIVVNRKFVLRVPDNLPLDAAAPLLCAGITVYSPLRYYKLDKPGTKLAVLGLGGLGHMAVKFAKAFDCEVTVISRSEAKKKEALETLGADNYLVSADDEAMAAAANTFDGIIDTVAQPHDVATYVKLLRPCGRIVLVGGVVQPFPVSNFELLAKKALIGGSLIGGIKETQEMLDFCGQHNITCTIEKIPVDYVNEAMERLERGDVHYRFVIDIAKTLVA